MDKNVRRGREDLMWRYKTAGLVQGAKNLEEMIGNFLSTIVMGGTGHKIGVITLIKMEEGSNFYINTQASVTVHLEFLAEHQLKIHSNPNNLSRFHLLWE